MKAGAISEVIGAILLISVSILAMGIVILAFFSSPLPTNVPSFSGLVTNSSSTIYITHEGGDTLSVGQFKILVDGNDTTLNFTQSINGPFSLGKVMNATLPYWPRRVVMVFNSSWGGETILLSADLLGKMPFTPPGWYNGAWLYRKKITILGSQVTGSHTGFPVLIYTGADSALRTKALNGGNDLLFTSWDGTTRIPHEIENFTGQQSGSLLAWVKVPALTSGTDTVIYLYYGNSGASNQQDPTSVWDSNYQGVWHLNQSSGTRYDSTANNNDLTDINTVGRGTGMIHDGADFTAANSERLTISGAAQTGLDITGPITLEAWVRTDLTASAPYSLIEKDRGSTCGGEPPYYLRLNSGDPGFVRENLLINGSCTAGSWINGVMTSMTTVPMYHLAGVYDGAYIRLYKNGVETQSGAYGSGIYASDGDFSLGGRAGTQYFDGILDEVRVSSTARSREWILTGYTNQNDPLGFITVSTQQDPLTMT